MTGSNAPDGVVGLEANPLGNRAVLLLGLGKLLLDAEVLVGLWTRFKLAICKTALMGAMFPRRKKKSVDNLLLVVDLAENNHVLSRLPSDRIHGGIVSFSN